MQSDNSAPLPDLPVAYSSGIGALMANVPMLAQIEVIATKMADAKCTIPKHLMGSPGDCYAVVMQAVQWGMNPYSVAQKTHLVNGTLGYEAQLVNAVIVSLAPTKDRLHFEWFGDWSRVLGKFRKVVREGKADYMAPDWKPEDEKGLGVRVWATMKGEEIPRELVLELAQAQVRNSTLWASDPRQQLAYLGVKRWARLYCPDVILGVYSPDELAEGSPVEREVNRTAGSPPPPPELQAYPVELFRENLPKWRALIEGRKKTPEDVIAAVETKGVLSPEQKLLIMDCVPIESSAEVVN